MEEKNAMAFAEIYSSIVSPGQKIKVENCIVSRC